MDHDQELPRYKGFAGFVSILSLRTTSLEEVPKAPGVYVLLCSNLERPAFLAESTGGHFKGKNPTVGRSDLEESWVPGTETVYIGKAGKSGGKATLRSRLKQYLDFGVGKPVGHWGGRYIWQLENAESLVVCWRVTADEEPRDVERRMLAKFEEEYGRLPFANLSR